MCFYTHPKHPDVKIAGKDIVCYKEGLKKGSTANLFCSYYRGHIYLLGRTNVLSEEWPTISPSLLFKRGIIMEGFHSYSNKKRLSRARDMVRVRCIIPEGAKYFYNPDDKVYVSNQIIVQEFIE